MFERGTPRRSSGRCGARFFAVARVEAGDEGVGERRDRFRGHHALAPPRVDRREQLVVRLRRVPGAGEQLREPPALLGGPRRLRAAARSRRGRSARTARRARGRGSPSRGPTSRTGTRTGPSKNAPRSPGSVRPSARRSSIAPRTSTAARYASTAARSGSFAATPPVCAQRRRRRMRVRLGHRLVGEPGVHDRAARPRRVHHVAAPEGVDPERAVAVRSTRRHRYCTLRGGSGRLLLLHRPEPEIEAEADEPGSS